MINPNAVTYDHVQWVERQLIDLTLTPIFNILPAAFMKVGKVLNKNDFMVHFDRVHTIASEVAKTRLLAVREFDSGNIEKKEFNRVVDQIDAMVAPVRDAIAQEFVDACLRGFSNSEPIYNSEMLKMVEEIAIKAQMKLWSPEKRIFLTVVKNS